MEADDISSHLDYYLKHIAHSTQYQGYISVTSREPKVLTIQKWQNKKGRRQKKRGGIIEGYLIVTFFFTLLSVKTTDKMALG